MADDNTPKLPDNGNSNIPSLPSGSNNKNPLEEKELDVLDPEAKAESNEKKGISDVANDIKDRVEDISKTIQNIGKIVAKLGPWGCLVVLIIIMLIGIIGFLTTIPGLMISKIKTFIQGAWDNAQSWFLTDADASINPNSVVDLANYLEEMDYDLIGYGFVTPNTNYADNAGYETYDEVLADYPNYSSIEYTDSDGNTTTANRYYKYDDNGNIVIYGDGEDDASYYYYNSIGVLIDNRTGKMTTADTYRDQYGIIRSTEDIATNGQGKITSFGTEWWRNSDNSVDTTLLRSYLLSDYRIYALRNSDETALTTIFNAVKSVFGGYDSAWSKGLLKFYYAYQGKATGVWIEDILSGFTGGAIDLGNSISIDGTKLIIRNGNFNNPITFDIDGWADRYGLSLEFLLSLHIATMQPDLVYAMLQSFDTEVQVYLNDSGDAEVEAGYVDMMDGDATLENDKITFDDVKTTLSEKGDFSFDWNNWMVNSMYYSSWLSSLAISKADAQYLLDNLPLESPLNCTGQAEVDIILKSTYKDTHWWSWDNLLTEFDIDRGLDLGEEAYNLNILDRDVETDEGDYDFNGANCTYNLVGNEDSDGNITNDGHTESLDDIIDDDDYKFFFDTGYALGYTEDGSSTNIESESANDVYCNNAVTDQYYLCVFDMEGTKTTRTWTATARDVDGNEILDEDGETEEVEYEWITYKFVVYKVGTNYSLAAGYTEQEPELLGVVIWEYITRDKTYIELLACGAIDENGEETPRSQVCSAVNHDSDSSNDQTKCCKNCQKYVKKVIAALAQVTDTNYASYTPYIARVLGSWFRDTYFIIPEEEDLAIQDYKSEASRSDAEIDMINNSYGSDSTLVVVDEEYLAETEEYWTAYDMKLDENGNATDEYQLYYLNPDGTTSETTLEEYLEQKGYTSQEEAEEAGVAFVKKAKTKQVTELSDSELKDVLWSAYEFNSDGAESGWIKITSSDENDKVNAVYDIVGDDYENQDEGGFYYNLTTTNYITQVEDAQRSETNSTVKYLFKYRKFYVYDGTTDRAELIAEDKEAVLEAVETYLQTKYDASDVASLLGQYGRSSLRQTYSNHTITFDWEDVAEQWLSWQLDMYYSGVTDGYENESDAIFIDDIEWELTVDTDGDGEEETVTRTGDPRNPDLIGTTEITKTSLTAFSILENTKTLAAEYAYRDFKELIVELDYFDKEDLSDKVDSVFTWILPEVNLSGWPVRPYDKQNSDYGALIESAGTYEYLEESDYEVDDEDEEEDVTDADESTSSSSTVVSFEGYEGGELVSSPVTGKVIEYGTHTRTNVYTEETEEVGYIIIEAISSSETFTSDNVSNNSNDFGASDDDVADGLNLFAEEYEDTCTGYTVIIDGINVDLNLTDNEGNNGFYEQNEVTKLYNSSETAQREANEELKYNAPFFVNVGGSETIGSLVDGDSYESSGSTYYIKEGKYIGTTLSDDEATSGTEGSEYEGPANYIRIVVKDANYSIVDNVEDFFDIPDSESSGNVTLSDDYDVHDESLFVTNINQFKTMFAGYENIINNAQAFIDIQSEYGVNAVFAACVTIQESGAGTTNKIGSAPYYNWFSISGTYNGHFVMSDNGRTWRSYESYEESIKDFANLIANGSHYFTQGNYTVYAIQEGGYCEGDYSVWAEPIVRLMTTAYEKIL